VIAARSCLAISMLMMSACQQSINRNEAVEIANRYMGENFAPVPSNEIRLSVGEDAGNWLITYLPPEGSVGGHITLYVGKRTGLVERVSGEQ
jgi:hypothetical protein